MPHPPIALAALAAALALAAPAAAETIVAGRSADGVELRAACPEAPERAVIAGHPVPVPADPGARLFRYRLDGAAPAIGTVERHPEGAALRFPDGRWLNADVVDAALPGAWQRLAFTLFPEAARACGAAAPKAEKRALFAAIQTMLAARGLAPGRTDGVFHPETGAAIRAWQAHHGLIVDGVPSPALRGHLEETPPAAVDFATLRAMAARVESVWRPPNWVRGAYGLTVPVQVRLDADGTVVSATAEGGDLRIGRTAEDAARTAGRLAHGGGAPRELVLHLTMPVPASHRKYARKIAQRLALYGHRSFGRLPPAAPGGRAAAFRLHIDGAAKTVRTETLDAGVLSPAMLARMRAAVARLPRIPPVPVEGGPNVFVMDVTLFSRPPHVLPGRVAFSDWTFAD